MSELPSPQTSPTFGDHLRGLLVLLHVVAVVGMAIPAPVKFLGKNPLEDAKVAGPLKVWEKALAPLPPEVLRAVVLHGGRTLAGTRRKFLVWSDPYSDFAGVYQSWHMFGSSPNKADSPEWWIEEEGVWRCLYRGLDPEARWRAELWENGRVRGMIPALGDEEDGRWGGFVRSVARRAAQDFPSATRFKAQRVPLTFPSPATLRKTGHRVEGKPKDVMVVALEGLR